MTLKLTFEQIAVSTADEARNYFTGDQGPLRIAPLREQALPIGTYRLIDGELFKIIPGPNPNLPVNAQPSRREGSPQQV